MTTTDIESKALAVVAQATRLVITTADDYIMAGALWAQLQDAKKDINETFGPIIDKAHKAHKEAIAQRDKFLKPVDDASRKLKQGLSDYDAEQRRKREEEQRRIEAELRKQEEDRKLAEAIAAEQAGEKQEAEAIISEPVVVPTVTLPKTTPKVEGLVFREVWDAEVTDFPALVRAVAAGNASISFLKPDTIALRQQAQSLKATMNIPGVKAVSRRV